MLLVQENELVCLLDSDVVGAEVHCKGLCSSKDCTFLLS